jgi:hypothetical protein
MARQETCDFNKEIREKKKEGAVNSVKSFELNLVGETFAVAGMGVGFFGAGGEISLVGRIIGCLALSAFGTCVFIKAESFAKKATSALVQANEIKKYVKKYSLGKQNSAH